MSRVPGSSINWFPADAIRERSGEKDPNSETIVGMLLE